MEDVEDMMIAAAEVCILFVRFVVFRTTLASHQVWFRLWRRYVISTFFVLFVFLACFEYSLDAVQAMEEVCMLVLMFSCDGFRQPCFKICCLSERPRWRYVSHCFLLDLARSLFYTHPMAGYGGGMYLFTLLFVVTVQGIRLRPFPIHFSSTSLCSYSNTHAVPFRLWRR